MVILCALLYPAFALLYFWGTEALKNFSFFGEDGYLFLRHRAEMTCDPKKIIAVKYAGDILKLFFALVLLVLFLSGCFAALLLDRGDREGWTGLLVLLITGAIGTAAAFTVRSRVKRIYAAAIREREGKAGQPGQAPSFTCFYVENPKRINKLLTVLMLLLLLLFAVLGLPLLFSETIGRGLLATGALLLLGVLGCLALVVREHRRVYPLLVIDRKGITDCSPELGLGPIPWETIQKAEVSDGKVELVLSPPCRLEGEPIDRAVLPLTRALSGERTLGEEIRAYHALFQEEQGKR